MNIVVGCNTLTQLDSLAYPSHCQLWYHLGRDHPECKFFFHAPRRFPIDKMRNTTAQIALEKDCKYIFFYDDDVLLPTNAFSKLYRHMEARPELGVASGLTYIRGYPFAPMLWRFVKVEGQDAPGLGSYKSFEEDIKDDGTVDVDAVGFSCALIRTSYLKEVTPPYFITGTRNTEDIFYCLRLKKQFPNVGIICDATIETSHIVERYVINRSNREDVMAAEESLFKVEPERKDDRGLKYLEQVKELFEQAS
jgi:hypothetical protein